ncbi:hypothetical protein D3C85_1773860 [compost metagenome]|jgi:hypothetical protein
MPESLFMDEITTIPSEDVTEPFETTIEYVASFFKRDRAEDYRRAWAVSPRIRSDRYGKTNQ